jgi:hypothetical protein
MIVRAHPKVTAPSFDVRERLPVKVLVVGLENGLSFG